MLFRQATSQSLLLVSLAMAAVSSPFPAGSVLAAVGNGQVKVFSPTGSLLETLDDGSGTAYTTGMVFDATGNLYVTNFGADTVSKFDANGNLVSSSFINDFNVPESIVLNQAGNFFVGGEGAAAILQYSPGGGDSIATYNVQGGDVTLGADWIDLEADQNTLLYDGLGSEILSYNVATQTQNAPFATGLPDSENVYEFRIIPGGTFAGYVLAADSSAALLLDPSGQIVTTYSLPGNQDGDSALNLDPNGSDFWTSDYSSGTVWEINIATGAIDQQWNTGNPGTTFGLVVAGSGTPEPGTLVLLGAGLAAFGVIRSLCGSMRTNISGT